MSSRYYNSQYANAAPYSSPYRDRSARYAQRSATKGKTRQSMVTGPYSPTLGRKRPIGHWKAKKKQKDKEDEERRTKLGEFNQEAIEAELNKYKKGVFYHEDDAPETNGHEAKYRSDKYSQYQLTRTQHPPPQVYDDLPRPVPPNYDERRTKPTGDHVNDDSKSGGEVKKEKKRKKKKKREKVVNVAGPRAADYYPHYNYYGARSTGDYYNYYGAAAAAAPPPMAPMAPAAGDYYNIYGYDHGVIQDDGSWYPYPDILQQQPSPKQLALRTPKTRSKKTQEVDLTNNTSDKRMSPGRRVNKIQKQLEYYFSPQNMNTDEFLRDSMDQSGWVNVDVICGFNRMKVLGATKELVVEAAYHSTSIEIDSKNPDKIRMTKFWKQYISEKKERKKEKDKKKRERERERQKEKELDEAELNQQTIESIVAGIERKHLKRKKRREQREKEKEKVDQKDTEKKEEEEEVVKKEDDDEDREEKEKAKEDKVSAKKEEEEVEADGDDMVEID